MKPKRTRAIVLRRTNYGEADRILQILTPNGKIGVVAKGVRREKSRLSGGIELFAICEVVIVKGKGDLSILTSSRLVEFYKNILEDYDQMQFAYQAIDLVSKVTETIDDTAEWYDLLAETLKGLNKTTLQLSLIQTWFYLQYAKLIGYELSLWRDIDGQKIIAENRYTYDIAEKGLKITPAGNLTAEHIKLLRLLVTKHLQVLAQISGINDFLSECLTVARQHVAL